MPGLDRDAVSVTVGVGFEKAGPSVAGQRTPPPCALHCFADGLRRRHRIDSPHVRTQNWEAANRNRGPCFSLRRASPDVGQIGNPALLSVSVSMQGISDIRDIRGISGTASNWETLQWQDAWQRGRDGVNFSESMAVVNAGT